MFKRYLMVAALAVVLAGCGSNVKLDPPIEGSGAAGASATGQGAAGRGSGGCRVQGPACLRGCRARLFPLDDDSRHAATGL